MEFRCAGIVQESIVDGRGIRMAVFCQGCKWHCKGCHNQHTWDLDGGYVETTEHVIEMYKKNPLLSGVTLTGGEPFLRPEPMVEIAKAIHSLGGNVWVYTGYTLGLLLDTIIDTMFVNAYSLLMETDVLIDGPFILDKRDLSLDWRGSSNQRIIDMNQLREDKKFFEEICAKGNYTTQQEELLKTCLNIQRL